MGEAEAAGQSGGGGSGTLVERRDLVTQTLSRISPCGSLQSAGLAV